LGHDDLGQCFRLTWETVLHRHRGSVVNEETWRLWLGAELIDHLGPGQVVGEYAVSSGRADLVILSTHGRQRDAAFQHRVLADLTAPHDRRRHRRSEQGRRFAESSAKIQGASEDQVRELAADARDAHWQGAQPALDVQAVLELKVLSHQRLTPQAWTVQVQADVEKLRSCLPPTGGPKPLFVMAALSDDDDEEGLPALLAAVGPLTDVLILHGNLRGAVTS
jgi:hypothetical protein